MKVIQVCPNPFPSLGGPAKTYRQFHEAVGALTLGFIAPDDGAGEESVVPLAAAVQTLGGKGLRKYYLAPSNRLVEAESTIASADAVVLHGLFTHPPVWAAEVCRRRGVPYVVALHGILDPWALKKTRIAKQIWLHVYGKEILARAAAVICATRREAEKAAPLLGRTAVTKVVSWACEIPDLARLDRGRLEMRRKLGFEDSDRVLVYLGRLHSMKRPLEIIRMAAKSGAPNLKLLMIGPDDDISRAQLEAEAHQLNWSGLRVVGPVFGDEKFGYLRAGDGFISLSSRENFNYGLAEAMAVGLAPILSPGNDLGWEFGDAGFAWLLKTDGREEAMAAIRQFNALPDENLWRRGMAAREWTAKNLGMGRFQRQLAGLMESVANSAGPSRS